MKMWHNEPAMLIALLYQNPWLFIVLVFSLLVAFVLHELAHALAADKLGDPTPRLDGRITLNPLAHLDPLGTVCLLLLGFGWGKPVAFDPYNLRHPKRDTGLIAAAGPATNLALALVATLVTGWFLSGSWWLAVTIPFIYINLTLAVFNLIPLYPLDGEKILVAILPKTTALAFQQTISRYGQFILLFLVLPINNGASLVSSWLGPATDFLARLFFGLVGIS